VSQLAHVSFEALIECPPELLYAYSKYLWLKEQSTAVALLQASRNNLMNRSIIDYFSEKYVKLHGILCDIMST
ncbi:MAG: hypothetical protein SGPRY_002010, partial [Prymnesium sp.]